MAKIYQKNFTLKCSHCYNFGRLPIDVTVNMLPVIITCEVCQASSMWEELPILPKVDPGIHKNLLTPLKYFKIASPTLDEGLPEETPQDIQASPVPFYKLARELADLTIQMLTKSQLLKLEIDSFQKQMSNYFEAEWKFADAFGDKWNEENMQEFLEFPFTAIPVNCEDDLVSHYARWILAPKFFDPGLGIKIKSSGGFRLELVNQYTRPSYPLDSSIIEELGVPESLDLKVVGNKIIGSSLPFCWKDIPGIIEDIDSSSEWISVVIKNSLKARQWLIQHGISAWENKKLETEDLIGRDISITINKKNQTDFFLNAWKKFLQTGRLCVFWGNSNEARNFGANVARIIRGTTLVFIPEHKDKLAWTSVACDLDNFDPLYSKSVAGRNIVYSRNQDTVLWPAVYRTKCCIVDMYGDLDVDILDKLYNYHGRLLILAPDPLMDFKTDNILASKVYGLVNSHAFEPLNITFPGYDITVESIEDSFRNLIDR